MIARSVPRTLDERLRAPRLRLVFTTIRQKIREHPELRHAPSLAEVLAIAKREDMVMNYQVRAPWIAGSALSMGGVSVITLNTRLRAAERRCVLLHELAHLWLGHCTDPVLRAWCGEECGPWWSGHVRHDGPIYQRTEHEADLVACTLLNLSLSAFRAEIAPYFVRLGMRRAA